MKPTQSVESWCMTEIMATYNQMVRAFGFEPNIVDCDKVHCSWSAEESAEEIVYYFKDTSYDLESIKGVTYHISAWDWKQYSDPRDIPDELFEWSMWYDNFAIYESFKNRLETQ